MNLNQQIEVIKTVKEKTVKAEGSETLAVWEPPAEKKFRLTGFTVFSSVETLITLEDESTVVFMFACPAKVNEKFTLPGQGIQSAKAKNKLNLKTKAEGAITASFYGVEDGLS